MADEVVSGGQQIASEATLQQLLNAVAGSGDSSAALKLKQLAAAAGTSAGTIKQETEERGKSTAALGGFANSLLAGTATSSQLAGAFTSLGGTTGMVASAFSKLLAIQEENFASYQKLSSSGVNFSGSLTSLRMAAANSYLTLDQFTNILKNNSESIARMGGTANDGAIAFSKAGAELMKGDVGQKLMAMGYTTEEVNNGLASYITMTGGRNRQEMANTTALSKAAGEYLTELDELAQVTGKSRQQQEQALKEASANEAYQAYLMTLDEEGKKKANIAMAEAMAKGGKGAAQALQSQLMGLPPMTKAAQEFTAIAPKMAAANNKMADAVKDGSKGVADIKRAGNELGVAANQTKKDLGKTGDALIMQGGSFSETIGTIFGTANRNAQQGVNSLADAEAQRKAIEDVRNEREKSQADDMAAAQKGFKELGAALMSLLSPFITFAGWIAHGAGWLAGMIGKGISFLDTLGSLGTGIKVLIGLTAAWILLKKSENASMLASKAGGMLSSAAGAVGKGATGALGGITGAVGGGGGGIGGGFVGFIKALGRGLASLAPIAIPMVIGATAVSATIAILGAGVAAAIALIGVSLPIFAKGLKDVAEIDGMNLAKVALGIAALGPALVIFTGGSLIAGLGAVGSKILNFFSGGGPIAQIKDTVSELTPVLPQLQAIGPALNSYATGIVAFGRAVSSVDIAKAEKLKEVMKGPGVLEGIGSAIKDVGAATAKLMTGTQGGQEKSSLELASLNNTVKELVRISREIADYTKQTVEATKDLSGDHFA